MHYSFSTVVLFTYHSIYLYKRKVGDMTISVLEYGMSIVYIPVTMTVVDVLHSA